MTLENSIAKKLKDSRAKLKQTEKEKSEESRVYLEIARRAGRRLLVEQFLEEMAARARGGGEK